MSDIIDQVYNEAVETLKEIVAIKSVSVNSTKEDEVAIKQSADFVCNKLKEFNVNAKICQVEDEDGNLGNPGIIGYIGASDTGKIDPSKPTVLLYAHHDVQPAVDANWDTNPWEATIKQCDDGLRMFGRGAADDGAGLVTHFSTLNYFQKLNCSLPANIKFFIEGEEEAGSPSFANFVKKYKDELEADVILVADGGNWAVGVPAITTTLRGVSSIELDLQVLEHDVHSGMNSGPVIDANSLLMMTICSIWDENGNIVVEGLLGAKGNETDEPSAQYDEMSFRKDVSLLDQVQIAGDGSIAGKLWVKPSVTVIGFDAVKVNQSSNVLASKAKARISLRVHPAQNPKEAADVLCEYLKKNVKFNAKFTAKTLESGWGFNADINSKGAKLFANSLKEGFGHDVVYAGGGGSIPFTNVLAKTFPNADIMITGVEDPDSRAHSDNESVNLDDLKKVISSQIIFFKNISQLLD